MAPDSAMLMQPGWLVAAAARTRIGTRPRSRPSGGRFPAPGEDQWRLLDVGSLGRIVTACVSSLVMTSQDDPLPETWEEFTALPWTVQQRLEEQSPDRVRELELAYVKEFRFPMLDAERAADDLVAEEEDQR